ncbi:MAG: hypothetical protein ABI878_08070 [Acidobacteriota bacterium]
MAHFFKPDAGDPAAYDVDGRLAPNSVWRVRIAPGSTLQIGLWGGQKLWVRSTNDGVVRNNGFSKTTQGDLTFLTLTAAAAGDCKIETGEGPGVWVTLEVEVGATPTATLNTATQLGTYSGFNAAATVKHFHQGKEGIDLLGGLSHGYMRWLEFSGQNVIESSGPPPAVKPSKASQPWTTYTERPKLVVVRQGWTFPVAGSSSVRNFMLEIWWLPYDDTEYQVLAGHATRAEAGDKIGWGIIMRPFAGDLILYNQMAQELAAAAIAAATIIVSAAIWKLSTRSSTPSTKAAPAPIQNGMVRLGPGNAPGSLWASIQKTAKGVVYRIDMIFLQGEGQGVETARATHREMIRVSATEAKAQGQSTFQMIGKQANPNFVRHADDLARQIGVPGSGKVGPAGAGFPDYEVTLDVAKTLAK